MTTPSKNPIAEFFGPPKKRPLRSNTMRMVARIYSVFPELNPLNRPPLSAQTPANNSASCSSGQDDPLRTDYISDGLAPRSEEEVSRELVGDDGVKVQDVSTRSAVSDGGNAGALGEGDGLNGSEMTIDKSGGKNDTETVDKMTIDDKETSDHNMEGHNVQENLLGVERILMDESDELGRLQLPDEDINFDMFDDVGSFLNTDVLAEDSAPVESNVHGGMDIQGNMNEDVVGEKKGKNTEVKGSTFGGDVASDAEVSVERDISNCLEVAEKLPGKHSDHVDREETNICNEKVPQDLSEKEGLNFSTSVSEGKGGSALMSSVDKEEHKSGSPVNQKTKQRKKADQKGVKSGKRKLMSAEAEVSNITKSGGSDALVHGKMLKQNVSGRGNLLTTKVGNCSPKSMKNITYTREQLLHLRKMDAVSKDILKVVQEIGCELFGGGRNCAARESIEVRGFNKEGQLGAPTEEKKEEEKDHAMLKNKKRGSSSTAKKENKKRKKRQKRAETNRKLGVKRLKLRPPVLKPKVVPPCRHYLKGSCHEGEKCNFSHDVIPQTKSTPCSYFARNVCLKGDDCPFDHQLSKYPCTNYATTGFCSRGDSCLFSHKIQDKEGSESTGGVFKEIKSRGQLDKSNSKQQLDGQASSSRFPSINLEENSVTKINQPGKAPKGLSFLSFGKSPQDDSGQHKKVNSSQQSNGATGTGGEPNQAQSERSGNVSNALMDISASVAPRGIGFLSCDKTSTDSSVVKTQTISPTPRDQISFGKSLLHQSSKDQQANSSMRVDGAANKGNQPNRETSSRELNRYAIFKDNPTPTTTKGITFPASGGPSLDDSGDKSQAASSTELSTSQICIREKGTVHESGKLKAIQTEERCSPTSSGQRSIKFGGPVKSTPSTAQRALLSTLAFAAKYESGIKMSPAAVTKEVNKNEATSSGSGRSQNEPKKSSAILEFLYSGGNKQKQ